MDPSEICAIVKGDEAWDIMREFRQFREDDDLYSPRLLDRYQNTDTINATYSLPGDEDYTFMVESNGDMSGETAFLYASGFIVQANLGPVTSKIVHDYNEHPHSFLQNVSITGFDDPTFQNAVQAFKSISDFMTETGKGVKPLPSYSAYGGRFPAITATSRLMTPVHYNRFPSANISARLDPQGGMKMWREGQKWEYTADNVVELLNLKRLTNSTAQSWVFEPDVSPTRFRIGDLVEIAMSFRVAPFGNQVRKVICHLERIIKISSSATSALLRAQEQRQAQISANKTLFVPNRQLPGPEGRPTKRNRMDLN